MHTSTLLLPLTLLPLLSTAFTSLGSDNNTACVSSMIQITNCSATFQYVTQCNPADNRIDWLQDCSLTSYGKCAQIPNPNPVGSEGYASWEGGASCGGVMSKERRHQRAFLA